MLLMEVVREHIRAKHLLAGGVRRWMPGHSGDHPSAIAGEQSKSYTNRTKRFVHFYHKKHPRAIWVRRTEAKCLNTGSIASYISKYISKSISDVAANKKATGFLKTSPPLSAP